MIFSTSIVVNNNLRERHEKILIIIEIVHFINMTFFFVLPLDLYSFEIKYVLYAQDSYRIRVVIISRSRIKSIQSDIHIRSVLF